MCYLSTGSEDEKINGTKRKNDVKIKKKTHTLCVTPDDVKNIVRVICDSDSESVVDSHRVPFSFIFIRIKKDEDRG